MIRDRAETNPVVGGVPADRQFADWVRPWWPSMSRLARHLVGGNDWEDVLQDALALGWRTRAQFDPDRGSPRTWLLQLVLDQARKHHRYRLTRAPTTSVLDLTYRCDSDGSSQGGEDLDLERALGSLTRRQRQTITLFYFLDLPIAEVAQLMGCAPGTIKSTLADARARLRDLLGDET